MFACLGSLFYKVYATHIFDLKHLKSSKSVIPSTSLLALTLACELLKPIDITVDIYESTDTRRYIIFVFVHFDSLQCAQLVDFI